MPVRAEGITLMEKRNKVLDFLAWAWVAVVLVFVAWQIEKWSIKRAPHGYTPAIVEQAENSKESFYVVVENAKRKIESIDGVKMVNWAGGMEPVSNFCPNCGSYCEFAPYCIHCGKKTGDYYYEKGCPYCHSSGSGDYCWNCGRKISWLKIKRKGAG